MSGLRPPQSDHQSEHTLAPAAHATAAHATAAHATAQSELPCDEVAALLPLVADESINSETDPALFAHLARCCDCQEALASHDAVTIALEHTRPSTSVTARPRRSPIHHVFLPWPTALAASLAAAVGLWMWLTTLQDTRPQTQAPTTQVIQVQSSDGHPVYVVIEGEQITVIDPRTIDGKAAISQLQVQPVKFITPQK